jgi:hypothetical protein|tara:strand:+ start:328 stop:633 length:306 start_codon:yes stop_codon:yes gene_type:complete
MFMNKKEAIDTLKKYIKRGDTIYTTVTHVTRTGMTRDIKVRQIKRNRPLNWTYHVANALEYKQKNNGVRIGGCGMDMGFALVYNLATVLYKDGNALKQEWL